MREKRALNMIDFAAWQQLPLLDKNFDENRYAEY